MSLTLFQFSTIYLRISRAGVYEAASGTIADRCDHFVALESVCDVCTSHSHSSSFYRRYDADGNGLLDESELRDMMEDLSELRIGHRNVPDELIVAVFKSVDKVSRFCATYRDSVNIG